MPNLKRREPIERAKIVAFLKEVIEVCKKHGLSISHEDEEGGFLIEPFDDNLAQWLMDAEDGGAQ